MAAFEALGLDLIPGTGLLPAVVPGAFDAWCLLLRDWGTWEFPDVLSFALGYARNGVHLVPRVSATIESVRPLFEAEWTTSAAVYLPGGRVPGPRALFARPELADTWERLCRESVGATREARIDAVRRAWYQRIRRGLGRSFFSWNRRAGYQRPAPSGTVERTGFRRVVSFGRGSARPTIITAIPC